MLDIPVGPTAKVRSMPAAQQLRKLFEYVADRLGLHLEAVITDGSQPIGNGIGPVLEARDVMRVLRNDPSAPADLRDKALRLAGRVIEFDPDVRGGDGWRIARDDVLGHSMPCAVTIGTTSIEVRLPGMPPMQCLSTTGPPRT